MWWDRIIYISLLGSFIRRVRIKSSFNRRQNNLYEYGKPKEGKSISSKPINFMQADNTGEKGKQISSEATSHGGC